MKLNVLKQSLRSTLEKKVFLNFQNSHKYSLKIIAKSLEDDSDLGSLLVELQDSSLQEETLAPIFLLFMRHLWHIY